jgi:hypothetical protein
MRLRIGILAVLLGLAGPPADAQRFEASSVVVPPAGFLALQDTTSALLLQDNSSMLCLEGGTC